MDLGLTKEVVFPHNICFERGGISPYVLRNVYIIGPSLIYLENINLILAFIINIISQSIEHLNISSAFIVNVRDTYVYTAIMINCPIGYLSGSVGRTREYITFIF